MKPSLSMNTNLFSLNSNFESPRRRSKFFALTLFAGKQFHSFTIR